MPANFPKLEALLGSKLEAVNAANVRRLVEMHAIEDEDLDFKREPHESGEKFAADVCAMANTSGGVLVIGVDEEEGTAKETTPFRLTDEGVTRMKQWVAEFVAPFVPTVIKPVPAEADPTTGYWLIIVPRSPDAPHAVRKRGAQGALSYYHRNGPGNRLLSESEVADRYRDRFRGERAQVDRVEQVRREGTQPIVLDSGDVWMAVTLVPSTPGSIVMSAKRVREMEQWAKRCGPHPGDGAFGREFPPLASTGVGRVILTSAFEQEGPPRFGYVQLHRDGAGFAARTMPFGDKSSGHLPAAQLIQYTAGLLNVLVGHAVTNTSTSGDALVRCELLANFGERMELGWWDGSFWRRYDGTRVVAAPVPAVQTHTINLDAVASEPVERLAATRLLVTDLVQAFGLAEVLHVTPEGHLNTLYWDEQTLNGWRAVADVKRESYDVVRGR